MWFSRIRTQHSVSEDAGSIPSLTQWFKNLALLQAVAIGRRCRSDLALLWLWCKPAAAALIQPLEWELPYTTGLAIKRKKRKERKINK